ncbi:MAG: HlyD family secretion protein [Cyclobacteriaceae bacterium]|nr:HlyD family secretion protein [Cyclobacteriaceae bacterium]
MPIFPKEIIESTAEYYLSKVSVKSKLIYSVLVLAIISAFAILPYLYIELSIKSRGALTPKSAKTLLFAPVTGAVNVNHIYENAIVSRGDTLSIIDTELVDTQIDFNERVRAENLLYMSDLELLSNANFSKPFQVNSLKTEVYRSAAHELIQRLGNINIQIAKARVDYKRDKKLFNGQVLSSKEFEKTTYAYRQAKSSYDLAKKEKKAQWEMDEYNYQVKVDQLISKIDQLNKERQRYFITAPISGVVQQYSGFRTGGFVYANQKLAEISPDSSLIAELYISPSDIGFVQVGKELRIQVDAFNYNQWGMLDAKIIEISDDILIINKMPVFRIKCSFDKNYLALKNGYKGNLKKRNDNRRTHTNY